MYVPNMSDKTLTGCLGVMPNVKLVLHVAIFIQSITTHTQIPNQYKYYLGLSCLSILGKQYRDTQL